MLCVEPPYGRAVLLDRKRTINCTSLFFDSYSTAKTKLAKRMTDRRNELAGSRPRHGAMRPPCHRWVYIASTSSVAFIQWMQCRLSPQEVKCNARGCVPCFILGFGLLGAKRPIHLHLTLRHSSSSSLVTDHINGHDCSARPHRVPAWRGEGAHARACVGASPARASVHAPAAWPRE